MWCRIFAGTTVRELRHMRHVPRASMRLCRQAPVVHRRPSLRTTDRLPLHEIEAASRAYART